MNLPVEDQFQNGIGISKFIIILCSDTLLLSGVQLCTPVPSKGAVPSMKLLLSD